MEEELFSQNKDLKIESEDESGDSGSEDIVKELIRKQKELIGRASLQAALETDIVENPVFVKVETAYLSNEETDEFDSNSYEYNDEMNYDFNKINEDEDVYIAPSQPPNSANGTNLDLPSDYTNYSTPGMYSARCALCEQKFTDEETHVKHLVVQHLKKKGECPICHHVTTYGQAVLLRHIRTVHLKIHIKCLFNSCQFRTFDPLTLEAHLDEVHKKIRPFKCTTCERSFTEKSKMDEHPCGRIMKRKRINCNECDFVCSNLYLLERHRRWHLDALNRKCEICKIEFQSIYFAKNHWANVHVEKRKYKCELCPMTSFDHLRTLSRHNKRLHSDSSVDQSTLS